MSPAVSARNESKCSPLPFAFFAGALVLLRDNLTTNRLLVDGFGPKLR